MNMIIVESSNIEAIGYDAPSKILNVKFKGGSTYAYAEVPENVYIQFVGAPSKGSFLAKVIKPQFKATKI